MRVLLVTCFLFSCLQTTAQKLNTDSLWRILEITNNDSTRFDILVQLNDYSQSSTVDSNFYYAKKILDYSEKTKNKRFIAYATLTIGYPFFRIGDYKNVQECITRASKIIEKYPDNEVEARINNYRNLIETNPNKKISYLRNAISIISINNRLHNSIRITATLYLNLARGFYTIQKFDSALLYVQRANELSFERNDFTRIILLQTTFANVYTSLEQYDLAYVYCKKSLVTASMSNQIDVYLRAYQCMFNYFNATKQIDSALHYQNKIFSLNAQDTYKAKVASARWLFNYYQKGNYVDSANKYMNFYIIGNDSLNNANKIIEVQKIRFEEELRQRDIEIAKEEEKESRNHNIQLAITAIAILSAIILFLLLSRSIIVSHKVVEFLGVIVLLVVFEFINLLIHPFLEKVTNHSPALMLIALVAIAALIVPLHHRLEKWTTSKLVEKNKAIRLASAKKTIEELGKPNNL